MNTTDNKNKFDSQYCSVSFDGSNNVVYLKWKQFCSFDDYRNPAMFASGLLKANKGSNFIIDARNGFEDDKADVEWGFSVLLPDMAKSDCKKCIFIMNDTSDIEGEIDMWTREFMKYFEVKKVFSYDEAVKSTNK